MKEKRIYHYRIGSNRVSQSIIRIRKAEQEVNIYTQADELNIDFEGFNMAFYTKTNNNFCTILH